MTIPFQLTAQQRDALDDLLDELRWEREEEERCARQTATDLLVATYLNHPDVRWCFVKDVLKEFERRACPMSGEKYQ